MPYDMTRRGELPIPVEDEFERLVAWLRMFLSRAHDDQGQLLSLMGTPLQETGEWFPVLSRSTTAPDVDTTVIAADYVKVGQTVMAGFAMTVDTVNSQGSGFWLIDNVPFGPTNIAWGGSIGSSTVFPSGATSLDTFGNSHAFAIINAGIAVNENITTGVLRGVLTYKAGS